MMIISSVSLYWYATYSNDNRVSRLAVLVRPLKPSIILYEFVIPTIANTVNAIEINLIESILSKK